MSSFSQFLRKRIQFISENDVISSEEINNTDTMDETFRKRFIDHLFLMHGITRASVPLMRTAHKKCVQLSDRDYLDLERYYLKHIDEEKDHDEWLLTDLQTIGVERDRVLSKRPIQAIAELVGSQYYWIEHWHPVTLLGYISVMEGFPPSIQYIENLIVKTGLCREAFSTMIKHSVLDLKHREDLDVLIDRLRIPVNFKQGIVVNALYSYSKLQEIFGTKLNDK